MYRYSPSQVPTQLPHPGYTPVAVPGWLTALVDATGGCPRLNKVVGLKSVAQLSLSVLFSDLRGITEVYNLVGIGDR